MMNFRTIAVAATMATTPALLSGQAARKIADGVFLLPGSGSGWVDLGTDVLAITGSDRAGDPVAKIRAASGKRIRAVFAPNWDPATASVVRLVPATRGGATGGVAFSGMMTVDGKQRVELRELERAVGPGNGIAYVPGAGVLFAGDLVGDGAIPDSVRVDTWIAVLERLRRLEPKVVVPGRGTPGGAELLDQRRTALIEARAHVRRSIEEGRSLDETVASLPAAGQPIARRIFREAVGLAPPAMITDLELRPGNSPTAKTPGWTKPKVVLVRDMWDKPARLKELSYVAPGVEIRVAKTPKEAAEMVVGADASLGWFDRETLRRGTSLRWVQSPSAGVEGLVSIPGFVDGPITLTNAQRVHGPPLAEHVFGLLFGLTRRIQIAAPLMRERKWLTGDSTFPSPGMPEVRGKTLLVVGLGGIGTEVAAMAHGIGMRVIATRNTKTPPTAIVDYVGSSNELVDLVRESDVVVNALPFTKATEKVFNDAVFRAMKPTAYLINIGRGGTVDTDALVRALVEKRIAGAGLDVTDPEPLPADHRLWSFDNVIITPHVGSNSDWERVRTWLLYRENLRRFAAGEPLLNVVDKKAGY